VTREKGTTQEGYHCILRTPPPKSHRISGIAKPGNAIP